APSRARLAPYTTLFRSPAHLRLRDGRLAEVLGRPGRIRRGVGTLRGAALALRRCDAVGEPACREQEAGVADHAVLGAHRETLERSEEHTSELQSRENLV